MRAYKVYSHTHSAQPWLRQLMGDIAHPGGASCATRALLEPLADALAGEIVHVLRFRRHHFATGGARPRSVGEQVLPPFTAEHVHAARIAERIIELGGGLDFVPGALAALVDVEYMGQKSLRDMIRENLAAERAAIDIYSELIRRFGAEDPGTRGMLEAVVATEQGHATHLERLLAAAPLDRAAMA